ncbi:MAG: SDR family NAD(P)-dependent oxidoreductase [Victivallaceae bacterium]|nr:SDR family NAD(P)-dependent oxidoreductase [Victivallaceae bacterium]
MSAAQQKVALITGVSGGLGEAMAEVFKEKGFRVIGACRSEPAIELDRWFKTDITRENACRELLAGVREEFGRLDVLINNSGKGNYATWEEFSEVEVRDLFELNFFALVNMTRTFLPLLQESQGTVINIASVAGLTYVPCMGPYCATKYAVCAFSDTLRAEVKGYGIRVLNVAPGRINTTGFSKRALGRRTPPDTPDGGSNPPGLACHVYRAYQRGRRSVLYPRIYIFFLWFTRSFPRTYDWAARKLWKL